MHLTISIDLSVPSAALLRLSGELDIAAAGQIRESASAVPGGQDVRLDLRDLLFLDCAGLHMLERWRDDVRVGGGSFETTGASPRVTRVVGMTGSDLCGPTPPRSHAVVRRRRPMTVPAT